MNILNDIAHRSWPLPSANWIMKQSWRNLLFIHWPIQPELLRPYIPPSLQLDIFNGSAWLSVVVFDMIGIYPRGCSSVSLTPKFSEVNVRTYVQYEGKPGVYFLSLDVGDWASLHIAKKWYRLPYYHAVTSIRKIGQTFHYESIRKGKSTTSITSKGTYTPVSDVFFSRKETLEHWLTERYCLYSTDQKANLYCGEIHHRPWPLQQTEIEITSHTLFHPYHIDVKDVQPVYHFSKGIDTLFWNIKKIPLVQSHRGRINNQPTIY